MAKAAIADKTVLFPEWKRKERVYVWATKATPVSEQLQSRHTRFNELQYFDEKLEYPRSLRYVTNQTTFFEDEQVEPYVLGNIVFEDGQLTVPANQTVLQQFLAIHPQNKANGGHKFYEYDPEAVAQEEIAKEKVAYTAMETFFQMDFEEIEPIARVMVGNIDNLTSGTIKRDLLIKVKADPEGFLKLADDTTIKMKNLTLRLIDAGIINIKDDNSTVVWASNGREIVKIPFSTDPVDTFSKYLKTDEGILLGASLLEKLK